ncbi:type VI secretion system baseplate subunit TssG [Serratia sp. S1B]|nr:type VI secretion system baseplate subunit TssG [Serratia sp. S1B]
MSEFTQQTLAQMMARWIHEDMPWKCDFTSLMRTLSARTADAPVPGMAARPTIERHVIGQSAQMVFSPREVDSLSFSDDKVNIQLFSLGVWGAQGAMPLHLSELVWSRSEQHDHGLQDFVDIFHHRALSMLWRAWFISQDTASLDRPNDETFAFYIGSLIGLDPAELRDSPLPLHARLASSAHLIRESRNPEGLEGALCYYFGIPVSLEEFAPHWIHFSHEETSILGAPECAMLLGDGAVLGETIQDRQHKFRLTLGPLTLEQYERFSPWGADLSVLCEWVRNFVGYEYAWDVQLILNADEVPTSTLEGTHQLGYVSWLKSEEATAPVSGMSFEPEHYSF